MRISLKAAAGLLTIAVSGCYEDKDYNAAGNDYSAANADYDANASGNYASAGAASWPEGARIVVEDGVTYRIDPGGTRIALGPNDARIKVIDGVRYRIDPGGTRVRIDEEGVAVRVDPSGVDATVPVGENTAVTVNTE